MSDSPPTQDPTPPGDDDEDVDPAYRLLLQQTQHAVQKQVHGVELAAPQAERPFLGRYALESLAGRGGMGTVLAAEDTWLERRVAIKLVNTPGPRERRRLVREGVSLAKLSHQNVVQVHDVNLGEHDDVAYVAMEYVEGTTLARWQASEPRPLRELLDKYLQAARGLFAAHQVGIVHRDFKPHNVLIDEAGAVKVADFGLACATVSDSSESDGVPVPVARAITAPQAVASEVTENSVGLTPGYCAPEQLRGERPTDKADQFAFCVALYEGLTGCLPFGACRNPDELARAVVAGIAKRPETAKIPRRLQRMLARGLALRPDERFRDMAAIIAVLEPRRSRWPWVSLALVPVAALVTALFVPTSELDPCRDPEREPGLEWLPTPQSWRSNAQADAASAGRWELLDESAAAYRESWRSAARDVCRAARRGELQGPAHDQALACLSQAARELNVVARLVATEGSDIDPFSSFDRLWSPSLCVVAGGRPAFTRTDSERDRELDEARDLQLLGDNEQALVQARALHARALAASDVPVLARVSFLIGKLESLSGDGASAARHLEEASFLAEQLADDVLVLEAYAELIDVAAIHSLDPNVGVLWGKLAEAKLQRSSAHRSAIAGEYHSAMANLEYRLNDFSAADEQGQRAYELLSATRGAESLVALIARTNRAAALVGAERFDEAIAEYQDILEIRRRRYGPRHHTTVNDELRLARAYMDAKEYAPAFAGFQRVEELTTPPSSRENERLRVSAVVFQCDTLVRQRALENAVPVCERASSLLPRLTGNERWSLETRAVLHGRYGLLLALLERYEPASEMFHQERELLLSVLPNDPASLAYNTTMLCYVLVPLQRTDECAAYLEQAHPWYEATGQQKKWLEIREYAGLGPGTSKE